MIRVKTLTIQLIDAQPDRIRICRVEGESLVTIIIPREDLAEAKTLPSIPQRGIYYLLDEDHGNVSRVYAGQTTQGITRLEAHKARKEFWNKAVMFLDDDQNISKDALDVLEAKAIDYVRAHGSYETDNSATPKPYIDPYKEEAVSAFTSESSLGWQRWDMTWTESIRALSAPRRSSIRRKTGYTDRDATIKPPVTSRFSPARR